MLCHHHQVPELGLRLELVSANTLSTVQVVSGFGIARESRISEPSVGSKHAGGAGLDLGLRTGPCPAQHTPLYGLVSSSKRNNLYDVALNALPSHVRVRGCVQHALHTRATWRQAGSTHSFTCTLKSTQRQFEPGSHGCTGRRALGETEADTLDVDAEHDAGARLIVECDYCRSCKIVNLFLALALSASSWAAPDPFASLRNRNRIRTRNPTVTGN